MSKLNSIIASRFRLDKRIGTGSFGVVYLGKDLHSNKEVAVKVEKSGVSVKTLKREFNILKRLDGIKGIPNIIYKGTYGADQIIVMDLLGNDIGSRMKKYQKLSVKTVVYIAIDVIRILQAVHSRGIVHRDIKPDNIISGVGENENDFYLIDFGISKQYLTSSNKHIPFKDKRSFFGTKRYASVHTHEGIEASRRDDLESLGYVLVYLLNGSLPWQFIDCDYTVRSLLIAKKKKGKTPQEICKGLPEAFSMYLEDVKNLEFAQEPNYDKLVGYFEELLFSKGWNTDRSFEWSINANKKASAKSFPNKFGSLNNLMPPDLNIIGMLNNDKDKLSLNRRIFSSGGINYNTPDTQSFNSKSSVFFSLSNDSLGFASFT